MAHSNLLDFDTEVSRFTTNEDWLGLIAYLRNRIRFFDEESKKEESEVLRSNLFTELSHAYSMLGDYVRAVRYAKLAISDIKKLGSDPINLHFGYDMLANQLRLANSQNEARAAKFRSITCVLTISQSEFVISGLREFARLERQAGKSEVAEFLDEFCDELRRERRWAHIEDPDLRQES